MNSSKKKFKIIFFGTSAFAAGVLRHLIASEQEVCAIVTRPDRPQGRSLQLLPTPVKETALQIANGIPLYQPEKASDPAFASLLEPLHADLFIVVAFGEILRKNLLAMPSEWCVNIHASLLPKYRGAAPMQRCLMQGDPESGITLIAMTPEMDAGDILAVEKVPIPFTMNFGAFEQAMLQAACRAIDRFLTQCSDKTIIRTPQDHSQATLAPKISSEEQRIDWSRPSLAIHNHIRAFSPTPGAWCEIHSSTGWKRLKIKDSLPLQEPQGAPGQVLQFDKQHALIACGTGAIELLAVQLEGKKAVSIKDFMNGFTPPSQDFFLK